MSSLTNGLEYISTTKRRITTQMQGKGVNIDNNTPFSQYPNILESELRNKSWQYPSDWFQLTPKAEFPDHTIELVVFDSEEEFYFSVSGEALEIIVYGDSKGGTYELDEEVKSLNTETTLLSIGVHSLRLSKNTGIQSKSAGVTTLKIVISAMGTYLRGFSVRPNAGSPPLPIIAVRAKETSSTIARIDLGHITENISKYMQYFDLSMVNVLNATSYQFSRCPQLVKCELPNGFVPNNYAFKDNPNLKEAIGIDFTTLYEGKTYVFSNCFKFKPPSFNYVGKYCYNNCDISGMTVSLPPITYYPEFFVSVKGKDEYKQLERGEIPIAKIIVPDTIETMDYSAFSDLASEVIVQLPSAGVELTYEPNYEYTDASTYFLYKPLDIENGENFYVETPISVRVDCYYRNSQIYLPHAPLKTLIASCSELNGRLESITFDWDNTDFSTVPNDYTGYVIDISGNRFNHSSLLDLFNNLPTVSKTLNIRITDNPGVSELTDEEIAIVIRKGYILTK